jgi:outer membrane murein-binding lipoprotein Lpp
MPDTRTITDIDLQQISTRNTHACHIVAGCTAALPTLGDMWQELHDALSDTTTLAAQVARLAAELERTRLDRADLRAAMRATLAAHADGEPDPLWYLRDQLNAPERSAASWRTPA